jgi:exocyst complex component 1
LKTIAADIDYLEAQAEGIQVQVANEKALQQELRMLIDTCALDRDWDTGALTQASFEKTPGLADIENTLLGLYNTMRKVDPSLCGYDVKDKSGGVGGDLAEHEGDLELAAALGLDVDPDKPTGLANSYGRMQVVQSKRDQCLQLSRLFIDRFTAQMRREFEVAFASTKNMLDRALSRKADREIYQTHRRHLWKYCALTLYARDMHLEQWNEVLQKYQDEAQPLFRNSCGVVVEAWKSNARKATGDEADLLFTSQPEKQHEGIATAARKLTVKRSQTLAGRFRSDAVKGAPDKTVDSRSMPYEVFRGVLDDLLPLVEMEQNFVIDFFHATTIEEQTFDEFLRAHPPGDDRKAPDHQWLGFRRMEPDRELARRVTRAMEFIFSFLEPDLQRLIDWVISTNPL